VQTVENLATGRNCATVAIVCTVGGIWLYGQRSMSLRMDRANQVRQILSTRGLTLYRVCQQSAEIFGRSSGFYVPHNLYYDFCNPPLISQFTNYCPQPYHKLPVVRLASSVQIRPGPNFRLRLLIPRQRTTLLDSSVYDLYAWIPCLPKGSKEDRYHRSLHWDSSWGRQRLDVQGNYSR